MWWGVLWTGFDSDGFGLGWLSQTETFLLCPPSLPQQGRHTCPGGAEAPMVLLGEFMHTLGDWRAHGCCWGGGAVLDTLGGLEHQWVLLGGGNRCPRGVRTPTGAVGGEGRHSCFGAARAPMGAARRVMAAFSSPSGGGKLRQRGCGVAGDGTWVLPSLQTSVCPFQALTARCLPRRSGCRRGGGSSRRWRPGSTAASRSCGGCACVRR